MDGSAEKLETTVVKVCCLITSFLILNDGPLWFVQEMQSVIIQTASS